MRSDNKAQFLRELKNWVQETIPASQFREEDVLDKDVPLNIKLIHAVQMNSPRDVKRLLDIGAEPFAVTSNGYSAFHVALMQKRYDIADMFHDLAPSLEDSPKKGKPKKSK